ncbi:hypothetical protein MHU86_315 [Fragilaria crotonensis]|nr:hypothetical protein MHU86_315 [Fragilaria crotonensis]
MVDPKRSSRSVKGSLHPLTAAALSALPPLGYKAPPTLIGFKTIDSSVIALRIKHYNRAYKTLSANSWNTYVSFGIQDFVGPDEYYSHMENESTDDGHLRLARYYRNHLENHAKIDGFLLQTISAVETALAQSHPGFFDMSIMDMDLYLQGLQKSDHSCTPMEVDTTNSKRDELEASSLRAAAEKQSKNNINAYQSTNVSPTALSPTQGIASALSVAHESLITQEHDQLLTFSPVKPPKLHKKKGSAGTSPGLSTLFDDSNSTQESLPNNQLPTRAQRSSTMIKNIVRVETRWAPKDFNELRLSSQKMYRRLAPILSCFNNEHSWMMEWQTDQMDETNDIDPVQLSKYLSIRVVPVAKEQCFYFSFRINASGSQFLQVVKSKVLGIAKRGENLTFDPSSVPASQGELVYIGDILLKDASVTHRGQYLKYLRNEVLQADTPVFDVKLRHSNPTGSRINILTVRCGKSVSTKLAEILSTALCGEDIHPEIFISRLALGANQTSKRDHERIYQVHNEFLDDVSHLLFSASASIDTKFTEFFDSGETISRTPRQWAKSLISPDGKSLEADLENGGANESRAVLVVPSVSLSFATAELQSYWTRRNPTLSHATKLYTESRASHPDIPMTVFTRNIDKILAKTITKQKDAASTDDSSTIFSPVSSLTGVTGGGAAGATLPKGSIAWKKPLQETWLSNTKGKTTTKVNSTEINQRKRIEILEAQLALRSGTNSVDSPTASKSAKSKASRSSSQSGLTAASAHSRLDKFESSLEEIKDMFKAIMVRKDHTSPTLKTSSQSASTAAKHDAPPPWPRQKPSPHLLPNDIHHGMQGILLFPPESDSGSTLDLLGTPKKSNPLKRRAAETPTKSPSTSTLSLQYNEITGSGGGDPYSQQRLYDSSDSNPASPALPTNKANTLFDFFPTSPTSTTPPDDTWGDSIHDDPGELHRIYFQNIDGLRKDVDEIALYVSSMAQLKVGTFCWADPGLDFSQPSVRRSLQSPIGNHFHSARSACSSSTLPETYTSGSSGYQPGGTFMATTGRWSSCSTGIPLVDPSGLGRWSGLCYLGKRGKRLAILTAYRSPRQQPTGGFGFFDQQHSLLLSQGVSNPNVRKQFIIDIILFVNNLQSKGYDVIVSLDANETLGQDKHFGLAHLIDECTLTDLHLLGPSDPPATYKYGVDRRIDFMFGSAAVASAICRAGYNAYDNGVFSKHRGLFIDLDFTKLMGSVASIAPTKARVLRSEDQPSVDRYLTAFKQYADDHRLWDRVKGLTTVAPTLTSAQCKVCFDAIDRDVTRGMLHAEKEARRPAGKYAWSPKLREAGLLARYWHLRLREVEKSLCLQSALAKLRLRLQSLNIDPADNDLGSDAVSLKQKWKAAIKLLRTIRNTAYDHRAVHLLGTLESYHNLKFSEDEIKAGARTENDKKIRRMERLINVENMRTPFRVIHASMKAGTHAGGLSKLFVPSAGVSYLRRAP